MAFIEIKNVFKTYAEIAGISTPALNGITLNIEKGDFAAIAGPSGSGKTTLLNLIGALDKPTRGAILFEGKDITAIPPRQLSEFRLKEIGFVFQSYNLINTLTAIENTEYVMLLQGLDEKARRERSEAILKRVGLGPFMHRRPTQMSGGQQQRVAVARAIVAGSKVILADEPTANLDSKTAGGLLDLMKEMNKEKGVTFLFSTHDKMVMEKADKMFQIRDGSIIG
ncbi:MAG: ABC transporter ATP-binding protein [Candidatus Omnitrophica bacterium]|nr:ABC transporter ATP-binding protein [Candidatus Omnitrophota bacterium]